VRAVAGGKLALARTLGTLLAWSMVAALAASPDRASAANFTIGATVWDVSSTPATVPIIAGMREAAKEAGVTLDISDPKWDASAQIDNIRDFVTRGVNAIAVFPIDIVGIEPAAHEAVAAGVPVIGAMGAIKGFPYVGVDDLEYGRVGGRLILDTLKDVKGPKRIAIFRGTAGGSPDRLRMQGINEVFKASGQDIAIESVVADWLPEKALTGFQDLLQRFPNKGDITLVSSMGNCMIPPSIDWAERNGRTEITFVTMDLCKTEEALIKKGTLHGAAFQDVRAMGKLVIKSLVAMNEAHDFKDLPDFAVNPPIIVCTQATFDKCEGRGF
jgi:ribose transport system substrate-binding protein